MERLRAFSTSLNALKVDKKSVLNDNINLALLPTWLHNEDFVNLFLPYVSIIIDSREQDDWIASACEYYGINHIRAKKNKKEHTENLKEGDITFKVVFGNETFDFTDIVAYERKGSPSEFYNNCTNDRDRVEAEFERQLAKGYKKFVLLLEFGNCMFDLIDYEFSYYNQFADKITKSFRGAVFGTVSSWKNPNKYNFDVIQVDTQQKNKKEKFESRQKLFWLMLLDMYYFFRQHIRLLAKDI